ncbi:hypothetical protein Tco_1427575 [Tanacetum coccineum]
MDPNTIVLDISSDEEDANWVNDDVIKGISDDDHNWITELLNEVNNNNGNDGGGDVSDGSDDVVVVSEVVVAKKNNRRRVNDRGCLGVDDDCVILESDPDNKTGVTRNDDPVDEDDLVVVSEKGQVACRDYPHSRHLCIKFPFASTPNQSHCDQCYCYVCDSLAPCIYWGNGGSYLDHCQATDKDDFWKLERQNSKNPITPALTPSSLVPPTVAIPNRIRPTFPVPSLAPPTFSVPSLAPPAFSVPSLAPPTFSVPNLVPPPPPTNLVPATVNNQVSSMNAVTSCPISSSFRVPSIINQNQVPLLSSRNKFQPGLVSQQLSRTSSCTNNLTTPLHKPVFKRTFSASFISPTTGAYGSNRFMENDTNLFRPSSSQPDLINTSVPFSQPNLAYEDIQPKSNNQFDISTSFQPSVNSVPFTTTPSFQLQGQSSLPTYLTPVASQQENQIQSQSQSQRSTVDPKFFNDISWPQSQTAHQPVTQSSTLESTGPTNASSHANGYGGAVNNDNDNFNWMFNNQQQETIRDPGPFGLNQFSPDYIDSGTVFEF